MITIVIANVYWVLTDKNDSDLNTLWTWAPLIKKKVNVTFISNSHIELKFRKIKYLAQDHTASKWWNWDLNTATLPAEVSS